MWYVIPELIEEKCCICWCITPMSDIYMSDLIGIQILSNYHCMYRTISYLIKNIIQVSLKNNIEANNHQCYL